MLLNSSKRWLFIALLLITSCARADGPSQPPVAVEESDGSPAVTNVTKIKVSNGTLTNDGGGIVSLSIAAGGGYAPGGTDVALADGGTGASLADPGGDRIFFWDDSDNVTRFLSPDSSLVISSTDIGIVAPIGIGQGGSGQTTRQAAIDALTDVTSTTTGYILTKDGSGNATFQAAGASVFTDLGTTAFLTVSGDDVSVGGGSTPINSGKLSIVSTDDQPGLVIKNKASQTANPLEIKNSAEANLVVVSQDGAIVVTAAGVSQGTIVLGSAGVNLTDDGDGAITFTGLGNGSDEALTLNLDDTSNVGVLSSTTSLATLDFGSIGADLDSSTATLSTVSGAIDAGGATSFEVPNGAAPTTDAFGEVAADNDAWGASRGVVEFYDGTASTNLVGTLASDTPTNGQSPVWNTGGTITWETPTSNGKQMICGTSTGDQSSTFYMSPGAGSSTTESDMRMNTAPYSATVSKLYAEVDVAPGAGSWAVTVREEGSNTTLTCTITDPGVTCSDTSNSFTWDSGNDISIAFTESGTATGTGGEGFCFEVVPT